MASSEQAITKQLQSKKVKRDVDLRELYLGENDLQEVGILSRFNNLKYLWLNNNQLRRMDCLSQNFHLSELYLHHNRLVEITGALEHLTSLQVLLLHNNQLEKLEQVVCELRRMQDLKVLNLFNNPIAQEPDYRLYVIHHVPSVELLDRQEVKKSERDQAYKLYDQQNDAVKETIAFGRRSEGPPSLYYPPDRDSLQCTVPADFEVGNNFYRNNPPYASNDEAVEVRHQRRSVMEYSSFDWSSVPRSLQRRTAESAFESPKVITTRFR